MNAPIILGIDPDTHHTALVLASAAEIHQVYVVRSRSDDSDESASLQMIRNLAPAFEALAGKADGIVVEGQQIYTGKAVASTDSIISLAHVAGALVAYANRTFPDKPILVPKPSQWKGNVPKQVHHARIYSHYGIEFSTTADYCYPTGCATASRIPGFGKTKKADWKHLGDAVGMALWGAIRMQMGLNGKDGGLPNSSSRKAE